MLAKYISKFAVLTTPVRYIHPLIRFIGKRHPSILIEFINFA